MNIQNTTYQPENNTETKDFSSISLIAIDFETSDYRKDSACSLGMVKIKDNKIIDSFYSLIRPPRQRVFFTEIHGFTWNDLKHGPNFAEIWTDIKKFIDNAQGFIAHNASFDRGIFYGTSAAYAIDAPILPFYCTLKAARKNFCLQHNKLSDVCTALNIKLDHHNALSDANAAARIFLYCLEKGYNMMDYQVTQKKQSKQKI